MISVRDVLDFADFAPEIVERIVWIDHMSRRGAAEGPEV